MQMDWQWRIVGRFYIFSIVLSSSAVLNILEACIVQLIVFFSY